MEGRAPQWRATQKKSPIASATRYTPKPPDPAGRHPPRRHPKQPRVADPPADNNRWGIQGLFHKLKRYLRIATRYDKLAANFLGFIKLASIMLWRK